MHQPASEKAKDENQAAFIAGRLAAGVLRPFMFLIRRCLYCRGLQLLPCIIEIIDLEVATCNLHLCRIVKGTNILHRSLPHV